MIDTIVCPACRRALRVPDNLQGHLVKCPSCEQTFTASENLEPAPRLYGQGPVSSSSAKDEPMDAHPLPSEQQERNGRSRGRSRANDDDDRPRLRSTDDDDDDDRRDRDDDRSDRSRYRQRAEAPGKVQAIAVMTLIGGIFGVLLSCLLALASVGMCLLWPGTYFSLVMGILCIVKGSQLLSSSGTSGPPTVTGVLQVINIICLDPVNLTLGILVLVFSSDPEVKNYYYGRRRPLRYND